MKCSIIFDNFETNVNLRTYKGKSKISYTMTYLWVLFEPLNPVKANNHAFFPFSISSYSFPIPSGGSHC